MVTTTPSGTPGVDPDRRVDLFTHLTDPARADFLASCSTRRVLDGERIYTQDDRHHVMYRLLRGRVWLSYLQPDGRELRYYLMAPGECVGISTLIDGHGLPQTAVARGRAVLQVVDQGTLGRLRRDHPSVNEAIVQSLCRDVRLLIGQLAEASLGDLTARVARRLPAIAAPPAGGDPPTVNLPQSELASLFGVSRQSLNKALGSLEDAGLVRRSYREVQLLDLGGLRERSTPR